MTSCFLTFDLEIAKELPDGETDWKAHAPLGITCAGVMWSGKEPEIMCAAKTNSLRLASASWHSTELLPSMTRDNARAFVKYLQVASRHHGAKIAGWNSLSFDWWMLAEESGLHAECRDLALRHYDIMFQAFSYLGFPVGLDAVSKGMGLGGKTEGVSGAKAPTMWANGQRREVIEYLARDVEATLEVVQAIEKQRGITWITKRARRRFCPFPDGLLTVAECLELPVPDNSWMLDPMTRDKFTAWMEPEAACQAKGGK